MLCQPLVQVSHLGEHTAALMMLLVEDTLDLVSETCLV